MVKDWLTWIRSGWLTDVSRFKMISSDLLASAVRLPGGQHPRIRAACGTIGNATYKFPGGGRAGRELNYRLGNAPKIFEQGGVMRGSRRSRAKIAVNGEVSCVNMGTKGNLMCFDVPKLAN